MVGWSVLVCVGWFVQQLLFALPALHQTSHVVVMTAVEVRQGVRLHWAAVGSSRWSVHSRAFHDGNNRVTMGFTFARQSASKK